MHAKTAGRGVRIRLRCGILWLAGDVPPDGGVCRDHILCSPKEAESGVSAARLSPHQHLPDRMVES